MNNFDYMGFSYGGFGPDVMFVVNAKKFSKENVLTLCKTEYEHLFSPKFGGMYKEPTLNNIKEKWCAYRMGVSEDWPMGSYTLVRPNSNGSFPVYVIDFDELDLLEDNNDSERNS